MNQSVLFGERLRELRAHAGLSQSEFAKIGGVTKKSQMLYESGERVPNALYLAAIDLHGISALYFLTGSEDSFSHTEGEVSYSLNGEEQKLLKAYRKVSKIWRDAAMGVLNSGEKQLRSNETLAGKNGESIDTAAVDS